MAYHHIEHYSGVISSSFYALHIPCDQNYFSDKSKPYLSIKKGLLVFVFAIVTERGENK